MADLKLQLDAPLTAVLVDVLTRVQPAGLPTRDRSPGQPAITVHNIGEITPDSGRRLDEGAALVLDEDTTLRLYEQTITRSDGSTEPGPVLVYERDTTMAFSRARFWLNHVPLW